MARYDFRTPRLYLDVPLREGATAALDAGQANYLANVLRLKSGDSVLVFNGRDGEWQAVLAGSGKGRLAPLGVGMFSPWDRGRPGRKSFACAEAER